MKKLLFAMAIGAALAWMFDPDAGSHRRETLKKRLEDKGLLSSSASSTTSGTVSGYKPAAVASIP